MLLAVNTQRGEAARAGQDGVCGAPTALLHCPCLISLICRQHSQGRAAICLEETRSHRHTRCCDMYSSHHTRPHFTIPHHTTPHHTTPLRCCTAHASSASSAGSRGTVGPGWSICVGQPFCSAYVLERTRSLHHPLCCNIPHQAKPGQACAPTHLQQDHTMGPLTLSAAAALHPLTHPLHSLTATTCQHLRPACLPPPAAAWLDCL
jgi:hypothetical protein